MLKFNSFFQFYDRITFAWTLSNAYIRLNQSHYLSLVQKNFIIYFSIWIKNSVKSIEISLFLYLLTKIINIYFISFWTVFFRILFDVFQWNSSFAVFKWNSSSISWCDRIFNRFLFCGFLSKPWYSKRNMCLLIGQKEWFRISWFNRMFKLVHNTQFMKEKDFQKSKNVKNTHTYTKCLRIFFRAKRKTLFSGRETHTRTFIALWYRIPLPILKNTSL